MHASLWLMGVAALVFSGSGLSLLHAEPGQLPKPVVSVSIPPQKWIIESIYGDAVEVHVVLASGSNPHTFVPSPREVRKLAASRLWYAIGIEFEKPLLERLKAVSEQQVWDASRFFEPQVSTPHTHHEGCDHGSHDPHLWMSPPKVLKILLGEAEQARRLGLYPVSEASVEAAVQVINTLDQRARIAFKPFEGRAFYVFHPSYGHFAEAYGLRQVAIEHEQKSPVPRILSKVITEARRDTVQAIFVQPQYDPRPARAVAEATGAKVVMHDPLSDNWPALMADWIAALEKSFEPASRVPPSP